MKWQITIPIGGMLNAYKVNIDGDLSQADAAVLSMLCRNKSVVEYGVGASTLILSQVASKVVSYDTETSWILKVNEKLENIENRTCEPALRLIEKSNEAVKREVQESYNNG